jgi:hypothetical protein
MTRRFVSLSALLFALGASGPVWAQGAAPTQTAPPAAAPSATQGAQPKASDFSDRDVSTFAQVNKKVQGIRAEYTQKLQTTGGDQQKTAELQREAHDKMVKAVDDSGLGVEKYNEIVHVAQTDPGLAQRIRDKQ